MERRKASDFPLAFWTSRPAIAAAAPLFDRQVRAIDHRSPTLMHLASIEAESSRYRNSKAGQMPRGTPVHAKDVS
jgi:hypothetical protein